MSAIQGSSIIPGMRYRNAPAAIDWLCRVFGFEAKLVVPGEPGIIQHAQLTLGNGMLMLGSERDDEFGKLLAQPDELDGRETQTNYIRVDDPDAVYERVRAAGGAIVVPIADQHYGGRLFTCRDLEGRLWSVGSYDPYAELGNGESGVDKR